MSFIDEKWVWGMMMPAFSFLQVEKSSRLIKHMFELRSEVRYNLGIVAKTMSVVDITPERKLGE